MYAVNIADLTKDKDGIWVPFLIGPVRDKIAGIEVNITEEDVLAAMVEAQEAGELVVHLPPKRRQVKMTIMYEMTHGEGGRHYIRVMIDGKEAGWVEYNDLDTPEAMESTAIFKDRIADELFDDGMAQLYQSRNAHALAKVSRAVAAALRSGQPIDLGIALEGK